MKKILIVLLIVTSAVACTLWVMNERLDRENDQRTTYTYDYDQIHSYLNNDTGPYDPYYTATFNLKRGIIENQIYSNKYFDISFPITENFVVLDDIQVATAYELNTEEFLSGRETPVGVFEQQNSGSCVDLVFYLPDGKSYCVITFINPNYTNLSTSPSALEIILSANENAMLNDPVVPCDTVTRTQVTYGNHEYECLSGECKKAEVSHHFFARQNGNKYMTFSIIYYNESKSYVDELLDSIN